MNYLGWYPHNDPVSRAQERTERMYEREDRELAERIAEERFGEHTGKEDDGPENDSNRDAD